MEGARPCWRWPRAWSRFSLVKSAVVSPARSSTQADRSSGSGRPSDARSEVAQFLRSLRRARSTFDTPLPRLAPRVPPTRSPAIQSSASSGSGMAGCGTCRPHRTDNIAYPCNDPHGRLAIGRSIARAGSRDATALSNLSKPGRRFAQWRALEVKARCPSCRRRGYGLIKASVHEGGSNAH